MAIPNNNVFEGPQQQKCDHEWEFVDDSFDHAFGTYLIRYWECRLCGKQIDEDQHNPDTGYY